MDHSALSDASTGLHTKGWGQVLVVADADDAVFPGDDDGRADVVVASFELAEERGAQRSVRVGTGPHGTPHRLYLGRHCAVKRLRSQIHYALSPVRLRNRSRESVAKAVHVSCVCLLCCQNILFGSQRLIQIILAHTTLTHIDFSVQFPKTCK